MTMAREFHKFPHEVIDLDLDQWSFNLLCLVLDSKFSEEPEEVTDPLLKKFVPDANNVEGISKLNAKLPKTFRGRHG